MVLASAAAYCPGTQVQKWNCKPCVRLNGGMTDVTYYEDSKYNVAGYVGATSLDTLGPQVLEQLHPGQGNLTQSAAARKAIVVAFRGTKDFKNWIQNLKTSQVVPTVGGSCSGCKVHKGFQQSYTTIRSKIRNRVAQLANKYNSNTVVVTGHSLGGALGNLAAWDLAVTQQSLSGDLSAFAKAKVLLYTYGQPRVGNEKFSKTLRGLIAHTWRVVHKRDIVPHLPPKMFKFHHLSREVWFAKSGPKCDHTTMCALCNVNGEDETCSNSIVPLTNIPDHLNYLQHAISGMC